MDRKTREALELFVEKANKLERLSFTQSVQHTEVNIAWNRTHKLQTRIIGPLSEQTDAFILTFRFFIQARDHCSFRWLAQNVLDDPGLSNHWKQEFVKASEDLNQYLNAYPMIQLSIGNEPLLTRDDLMRMVIYGDLAHATSEKREKLEIHLGEPVMEGLYRREFYEILSTVHHQFIAFVARISVMELNGEL